MHTIQNQAGYCVLIKECFFVCPFSHSPCDVGRTQVIGVLMCTIGLRPTEEKSLLIQSLLNESVCVNLL